MASSATSSVRRTASLIGKRRIKVYPAEEALGLVFMFIGDTDAEVPPLR